tara:strand:- start:466 stop:732 length:267 start_codon:yes stop_codon:yes gene_type:complete
VSDKYFTIKDSLFDKTEKAMVNFCHNLFLSNAVNQCADQLVKAEEEYNRALLKDDEKLIEQKKLEMQAYQSSLTLTAYMLNEVDEVST